MSSVEYFWKENEAFFRSAFRPEEKLLHIEELRGQRLLFAGQCSCVYIFFLYIAYNAPIGIKVAFTLGLIYITVIMILKISSGLFRRKFIVLTTKAVYYCHGLRGIVAYEWPLDNFKFILDSKGLIRMVSRETPGSIGRALAGGANPIAVKSFWLNLGRLIFKKPLVNTICDLSGFRNITVINDVVYAMFELRLKPSSKLLDVFKTLGNRYPQIEYKSFSEVYPLWRERKTKGSTR